MDYITRNVTQNLLDKLPDDVSHFKLNDLESYGIPDFVVDRIQVELENNLAESLVPPETDWANMNTESVKFAWNQFVRTIRAEAHLPASYASTVMETAVGDIIDILIQPRKNIAEIIYGNDEKLSYNELLNRIRYVVVYTYLADALTRYMTKKELKELNKEKSAQVLHRVDDRLTAKYTPLNWAQLLEPWFKLMGENLDSEPIKLFFEDKGQQKIAKLFEKEENTINRTRLIEILSNPDLSLREGESEISQSVQSASSKTAAPKEQESGKKSFEFENDENNQKTEETSSEDVGEDAEARLEEAKKRLEQLKSESPAASDSDTTNSEEGENEKEVAAEESDDNSDEEVPLSEMYNSEESEENDEPETDVADTSDEDTGEENEDDSEEEDAPIWQRFVSGEEEQAEMPAGEPDEDEVDRLANFLSYNEDRFINELFSGEPGTYRQALEKLASHDDWQSAGRYLHKQIFAAHNIDMYDEVAVDFTDQLQDYFSEMKK